MAKRTEDDLAMALQGRPVVIWGARMTGIGFLRLAIRWSFDVRCFVDSDEDLQGKTVCGVGVSPPEWLMDAPAGAIVVVAVAAKEDEIAKRLEAMGVPYVRYSDYCEVFYTVDISSSCNLRCASCTHVWNKPVPSLMDYGYFTALVEKIKRDVGLVSHICLYSWGEPLLHPDLGRMVEHLHESGISAAVSTNLQVGMMPIERLIEAAPDYLKISTSGMTPETYDNTHAGGNVWRLMENLYLLRRYADLMGYLGMIEVNWHIYRDNVQDVDRMRGLCDDLGFIFSSCYATVNPVERLIERADGRPDHELERLEPYLLVGIDAGVEAAALSTPETSCRWKTNQTNINADGSVMVCCMTRTDEAKIADSYLDTSYEEIAKRKAAVSLCKRCLSLGLPGYLMGRHADKWRKVATWEMLS